MLVQSFCIIQPCLKLTLQVMEGRELPDPPLLRLESEAGHAYLSMLNTLYLSASQECKEGANVEPRLLQLCTANLERFEAGLLSGMLPGTSSITPGTIKFHHKMFCSTVCSSKVEQMTCQCLLERLRNLHMQAATLSPTLFPVQ